MKVLVFLSMIVFWIPVNAASFNCGKASTGLEKAICGSTTLDKQDGELGKLYFSVRSKLDDYTKVKFVQEHKQWLKSRNKECGSNSECLSRLYKERNEALAALDKTYNWQLNHVVGSYSYSKFCDIDLIISKNNNKYLYELSSKGKNGSGEIKIAGQKHITFEGLMADTPSDYVLNGAIGGFDISIRNHARYIGLESFSQCFAKYLVLEKNDGPCNYRTYKPIELIKGRKDFAVAAEYTYESCSDSSLILSVNDGSGNKVLAPQTIPMDTLRLYEGGNLTGKALKVWAKKAADSKLNEFVKTGRWPAFKYSTLEKGYSIKAVWRQTESRTDLSEFEKSYIFEELEGCPFSFDISKKDYEMYQPLDLPLFGFSLGENGQYFSYIPTLGKAIQIGTGCLDLSS